ncbi:MAG TPA: glycosyltransferase family 2 protein [Alphaproteobacteria bacterium]|nr:glycosyltransferase family 2 protein [Alphaproteobacteria bacterium]
MTGEPRVSVVMPVYNRAALVANSLESVLRQDFKNFEIVLVDDGSTDDLGRSLAPYSGGPLRLIRQEANKGSAAARNRGIRESGGAYIAFLDSDDEWLPGKLTRQVARLDASPRDVAVSITGYILERDRLGRQEIRPLASQRDWHRYLLGGCTVSMGSCALMRRAIFDEVGFFDEAMRRLYDWDWLLRYTRSHAIANLEEPLAIVHTGAGWPSVEAVDRSTRQMRERHERAIAARSSRERRLFLSSLDYERAVALYHSRRVPQALWPALRAIVRYPGRGDAFYRRLLSRVGDVVLGRRG